MPISKKSDNLSMNKVFLIHGFEGSPNGGWRPWLMTKLNKHEVWACSLSMPSPEKPMLKEWLDEIKLHVERNQNDNIYLVGHSLGGTVILRYLETYNDKYYIVGKFLVRVYEGELMFVPSLKYIRKEKNKIGEEINHFMWHATGQYHIKKKNSNYDIQQPINGTTPLRETGFQPLINIHIRNITRLISKQTTKKLDVILDIGNFDGNICIEISLLSGRWLLKQEPQVGFGFMTSTKLLLSELIAKDIRFIGPHSDNADKIIQFFASKIDFPDPDQNINVMLNTFPYQNLPR